MEVLFLFTLVVVLQLSIVVFYKPKPDPRKGKGRHSRRQFILHNELNQIPRLKLVKPILNNVFLLPTSSDVLGQVQVGKDKVKQ